MFSWNAHRRGVSNDRLYVAFCCMYSINSYRCFFCLHYSSWLCVGNYVLSCNGFTTSQIHGMPLQEFRNFHLYESPNTQSPTKYRRQQIGSMHRISNDSSLGSSYVSHGLHTFIHWSYIVSTKHTIQRYTPSEQLCQLTRASSPLRYSLFSRTWQQLFTITS